MTASGRQYRSRRMWHDGTRKVVSPAGIGVGMKRALAAAAVAAAALGAATPSGPAEAGPTATAARYCGKADIGFTSANVRARNVRCSTARRFVRRNSRVRRSCTDANDFCRVTYYKGYRCVKSGSSLVKVSCRKGRRVVSETHGD